MGDDSPFVWIVGGISETVGGGTTVDRGFGATADDDIPTLCGQIASQRDITKLTQP